MGLKRIAALNATFCRIPLTHLYMYALVNGLERLELAVHKCIGNRQSNSRLENTKLYTLYIVINLRLFNINLFMEKIGCRWVSC